MEDCPSLIVYNRNRLLFSFCPMAEDPSAKRVDWVIENKVEIDV